MRVAFVILISLGLSLSSGPGQTDRNETRAMWVVRNSLSSKEKIDNLVKRAAEAGFNTLFVQVRGRGDAYYASTLEPRSEALKDAPSDFDPLAEVIKQANASGIKVHAWVNTMYVWNEATLPQDAKHILIAHRNWIAITKSGDQPLSSGKNEGAYLCPSNPEARQHLRAVLKEIAKKYDIAGIHLDYIRYPSSAFCYCDCCLRRFKAYMGMDMAPNALIAAYPQKWDEWRREQITSLVKEIRKDLGTDKELSAAVWANQKLAVGQKMQDWPAWCKAGLLDEVVPMNYVVDELQFRSFSEAAKKAAGRTKVVMGIGAWRLNPEQIADRIRSVRSNGLSGFSLFSYGGITADGGNLKNLEKLKDTVAALGPP
jgi:uncharacterized lipoprotein YddW (UPF0748 family)